MNTGYLESVTPHRYDWDTGDQLKWHVYHRSIDAFRAGDAARDAIMTTEDLEARKAFIRRSFIENLGELPDRSSPLNPRIVGTIEDDGFRIEKVIFESRPNVYVTANLYIPDGITSPSAAVLFLCGHHYQAKHEPEYQIVCRYLVKAGLIVFAQDPIGQGERLSYYEKSIGRTTVPWGCPEHDHAGWQCTILDDAIARYFVHDSMRSIDYLLTRPEIDPARIGVTGNSGGGTQTSLMMICDPRIAAAIPTTFIMNREMYMHNGGAQDQEQVWPGMTALGFDHEDILLMMTPKPVRVQAVTADFFPIESTRRTVERCRRIWEICGKPENIDLVEDNSVHIYTRKLARSAAEFFARHLLGRDAGLIDADISPIEPSRLWCTVSGQVRGDFDDSRAVYEENQDRLALIESERLSISEPERKERALAWLKERVNFNRKPCDLNPRYNMPDMLQELIVQTWFWWSQEGIINSAHILRDYRYEGNTIPATVALWDGGTTSIQPHMNWIRETCRSGRSVIIADITGIGGLIPNLLTTGLHPLEFYGVIHKLTDDLIWLNDSLAAMCVYDTIRLLDMINILPGISGNDIWFYTDGRYNIYPLLASAIDDRIAHIDSLNSLTSYADLVRERHYDEQDAPSIVFPGILRYLDLPDIARWQSR